MITEIACAACHYTVRYGDMMFLKVVVLQGLETNSNASSPGNLHKRNKLICNITEKIGARTVQSKAYVIVTNTLKI